MATEQTITDESVVTEAPVEPSDAAWEAAPVTEAPADAPEAPTETPTEEPPAESPGVELLFNVPEALRPVEPEPGLSNVDQEDLVRLRGQEAEILQTKADNAQATSIQTATTQYINSYQLDEQTARFVATEVEKAKQEGKVELAQEQMKARIEVGRRNAAQQIGKEHGVDPQALMSLDSPAAMEREAKWIVNFNTQGKDIKSLKKDRVPEQTFADGGSGSEAVNSDTIDKLWLDFDNAHPNQANPYEARYQRFLDQR